MVLKIIICVAFFPNFANSPLFISFFNILVLSQRAWCIMGVFVFLRCSLAIRLILRSKCVKPSKHLAKNSLKHFVRSISFIRQFYCIWLVKWVHCICLVQVVPMPHNRFYFYLVNAYIFSVTERNLLAKEIRFMHQSDCSCQKYLFKV